MQLTRKRAGRITSALGLMTAQLLAVTAAHAQDAPIAPRASVAGDQDLADDTGLTRIDSAVLFYQEAGGRVHATEAMVSGTLNSSSGDSLSLKYTSDTLTGATPNGAAPWTGTQTFITPARTPGTTATITSSSGNSTIVTIPGTGTTARQYTAAAHTLPVDSGFQDQRHALEAGYSLRWNDDTKLSFGGGASVERDYSSYWVNAGFARDLFQRNTTLTAGVNLEFDTSDPAFGTPTPLTVMNANPKGASDTKQVYSLVVGVTQVMSRRWLMQLSYSAGLSNGYQTDPYRIISVVDPLTGAPLQYLYEARPTSRTRQSLYVGNKISIGPTVADVSARLYHDDWGVDSITAEIGERIALGSRLYVEPHGRYYKQTAANFFHDYLIGGQALPAYATSDSRLGDFSAKTLGLRLGYRVGKSSELYLNAEDYQQTGKQHPAGAIGGLATENLFTGVKATSLMAGFSFAFR